ncbi:MAG: radical SAM protein [Rickettsiales bacterium]|jgi:23S rRNA (adenine2503-C2)-methyltransferase|nr:radical SAM protein [Rickettsiales bacterium]
MTNGMTHQKIDSSDRNVSKFIFTGKDVAVESVLYRYPEYNERTVLCVSTQSGCPVGCTFCGTGRFFARSLTDSEIIEQVQTSLSYIDCNPMDIKKFQIMFMSMGEPMLNLENLIKAIKKLHTIYPTAQLLVSTSAPHISDKQYELFFETAREIPQVGLQFSVHESNDIARKKLIPTKTSPLERIGKLGERFALITNRKPYFNYCVHHNNNKQKNIDELLKNFNPNVWEATLSVICEKDNNMKNAIEQKLDLIQSFQQEILNAGYSSRVFNPAGQDDIGGGCGQLWYFQEWVKKHLKVR